MSSLSHPNIVTLFGFALDGPQFYVVLEWAPYGNLYEHLHNKEKKPSWK